MKSIPYIQIDYDDNKWWCTKLTIQVLANRTTNPTPTYVQPWTLRLILRLSDLSRQRFFLPSRDKKHKHLSLSIFQQKYYTIDISPDSKVHGANMGPTWVLSAPDGSPVGPANLAIWVNFIP